jgi:hypothetical protein
MCPFECALHFSDASNLLVDCVLSQEKEKTPVCFLLMIVEVVGPSFLIFFFLADEYESPVYSLVRWRNSVLMVCFVIFQTTNYRWESRTGQLSCFASTNS